MLDVLPFAPELILQYFDLVILGIVLLCALVGFIRGTYKSTYYFIVTLVIFLVSWFLFDPIAKAILNFDMSSFNISIDGTKLTTLKEYVFNLISTNSPDFAWIVENGSYSSALVVDVLTMAIRLVLLILTIILSFTLYRIISGIIWLIVRPKKSKRKKKKIGSRFGGMGIGALKGLGYSLLLVFIIAGISSVTQSITSITEETNEHALVLVGDTATLVKLDKDSNNLDDTIFGEYSDVIDLLNGYHDTITGKIFGAVKFGKAGSIDEMMFDSIFSVKNKNGNVKLRKELQTVAKALSTDAVKEIMSDGFSTEKLFELDKEDIKKIADALSELKIVKVVVPVGLEFVLYSDGEEFASIKEELANNFAQFNDINYSADIKRLGYAFADFTDLIPGGDFENIDYLNLDADLVDQIMSQIGELELLETVAPIAVSYILNMENIKSIFEEMNMPIEDLGLTDLTGKDWQTVLGVNLPSIYRSFQEIGIKMIESEIDLTDIDISKVDNLSEKIMDSKILGKAVPVLSKFAVNEFLPDQYNDLFDVKVFDEITQENLWGDELKNLLKAAITLVQKGIMEPDVDPLQVIKDLKAKDIEDLGLYLSQSIIITKHLNPLIDFLFAGSIFGDGTLQGLSDEEWQNPLEIQSLFFAIQDIVITGLLESDDPMSSIGSLDDARIQSLSDNLSSSKFITKNLNPIISLVMEQAGFEKDTLQGLTDEEWQDKNELRSLLMGIKDIFSIGLLDSNDPMSALGNLEDTQIHSLSTNLSSSKFITKNLNPILDMVMSNANLGFEIQGLDESKGEKWTETELYSVFNSICILAKNNIISDSTSIKSFKNIEDNAIEDLAKSISNSVFMKKNLSGIMDFALDEVEFNIYHLNQDEWTVTEIDAIFKSVKIVANMSENGEFSIDTIMNIEENDLDTFLQSKLMRESIKNTLIDLAQDGKELEVLKGVEENPNPNKYAWDDVTSPTTISLKNQSYDITPVTNANKYYIYGDGIFLGSTSLTSINLDSFNETFLNNNTYENYTAVAVTKIGELNHLFRAITCLEINDVDNFNLDLKQVIDNQDQILSSYILFISYPFSSSFSIVFDITS